MINVLYDKVQGAYLGSIIGDAMGGPVEGLSHTRIREEFGVVQDFLEYEASRVHPGGALTGHPGSYTDDTIGKNIIASAVIRKGGRVRAEDVVQEFLHEAFPEEWWPGARLPFFNMHYNNIPPRINGYLNFPGGGSAWYTPLAIVNGCNPQQAAYDSFDVASVWKTGVDRDLVCSVQAGVSEAMKASATIDSVVEEAVKYVGKEAKGYILNAVGIASSVNTYEQLVEMLYKKSLVDFVSDKTVFPNAGVKYKQRKGYGQSVDLREQVSIAFAMFYFSKGDPKDTIINTVNFGRDCDTIAANSGALAGAFQGASSIPQGWIKTILVANPEPNLIEICKGLYQAAVTNIEELTIALERVTELLTQKQDMSGSTS